MERNVSLPGLSYSQYSIETVDRLRSLDVSEKQLLHYYLECFHEYYNADFILRVVICIILKTWCGCARYEKWIMIFHLQAAKVGDFQAVAKICCLNYRFYEAFFYELKSLLSYVRETYFMSSFKDCHEASKNGVATEEAGNSVGDRRKEEENIAIVEDVIAEAVSILKYYCEMTLKFTSRKIKSFLKKVSVDFYCSYFG